MSDTIKEDDDANWSIVLRPKKKLLDLNLREIYHYRDLIVLFINRDFVTVYKQTILGPLWFIISPLFTTIMYTFVFGASPRSRPTEYRQPFFITAGRCSGAIFPRASIAELTSSQAMRVYSGRCTSLALRCL